MQPHEVAAAPGARLVGGDAEDLVAHTAASVVPSARAASAAGSPSRLTSTSAARCMCGSRAIAARRARPSSSPSARAAGPAPGAAGSPPSSTRRPRLKRRRTARRLSSFFARFSRIEQNQVNDAASPRKRPRAAKARTNVSCTRSSAACASPTIRAATRRSAA